MSSISLKVEKAESLRMFSPAYVWDVLVNPPLAISLGVSTLKIFSCLQSLALKTSQPVEVTTISSWEDFQY